MQVVGIRAVDLIVDVTNLAVLLVSGLISLNISDVEKLHKFFRRRWPIVITIFPKKQMIKIKLKSVKLEENLITMKGVTTFEFSSLNFISFQRRKFYYKIQMRNRIYLRFFHIFLRLKRLFNDCIGYNPRDDRSFWF